MINVLSHPVKVHTKKSHQTGLIPSLLCGIHCMITPFLISFLPSGIGGWFQHPLMELVLISIGIGYSAHLIHRDYASHRRVLPWMLLFFVGALFFTAHFFEDVFYLHLTLNIAAGIILFLTTRLSHRLAFH
jgi:hypothetical protein